MPKNYKSTIYLKTVLDAEDTLKQAKKIREELGKKVVDKSSLSGVDKQLLQIEETFKKLQAAEKAGFSNDNDLKQYMTSLNKMNLMIHQLVGSLSDVGDVKLDFDTKRAQEQIKQLKKKVEDMEKSIKSQLTKNAKNLGLSDIQVDKIFGAITGGDQKQVEKVYNNIRNSANKAVKAQEEVITKLRETAQIEAQDKALSKNTSSALKTDKGNTLSRISAAASFVDRRTKGFNAEQTHVIGERGGFTNKISTQGYDLIEETYREIITDVEKLKGLKPDQIFQEINNELKTKFNIQLEETDKLIEQIASDFSSLNNVTIPTDSNIKGMASEQAKLGKLKEQQSNIKDSRSSWLGQANNYSQLQKEYSDSTSKYSAIITDATSDNETFKKVLEELLLKYEELNKAQHDAADGAQEEADKQKELNNTFENIKGYIASYLSLGAAASKISSEIRKTWEDTKQLDQAFASIAMVTDYSVQGMWNSYEQYNEMAKELGQTTQDVIKSSALFYQQGLDTAESLKLTESTMKLATLAGADFETATEQMTAALRGFHMEMDQGSHITDVYSELAAKAAADVNGIAYAMSKTASIASSAGMAFETTSAFLTQMINFSPL